MYYNENFKYNIILKFNLIQYTYKTYYIINVIKDVKQNIKCIV